MQNKSPLHLACENGNTVTALALISKGADINVKNDYGWTPLHLVSIHGHTETALALILGGIYKGADIHAKDNTGRTPLHYASGNGNTETALALISKGANINAKNIDGWTPLHFAIGYNLIETALALLSKGADVHAENENRQTPLHFASGNGNIKTALVLISYGANPSHINNKIFESIDPNDLASKTINFLKEYHSKLPKQAVDNFTSFAKLHSQDSMLAGITSFVASQAIEKMMAEARQTQSPEITSDSQAQTQSKQSSAKRIVFKRRTPS